MSGTRPQKRNALRFVFLMGLGKNAGRIVQTYTDGGAGRPDPDRQKRRRRVRAARRLNRAR